MDLNIVTNTAAKSTPPSRIEVCRMITFPSCSESRAKYGDLYRDAFPSGSGLLGCVLFTASPTGDNAWR